MYLSVGHIYLCLHRGYGDCIYITAWGLALFVLVERAMRRPTNRGAGNKAMTPRFLCAYISINHLLLLESGGTNKLITMKKHFILLLALGSISTSIQAQNKQVKSRTINDYRIQTNYGTIPTKETFTCYIDDLGNEVKHGSYNISATDKITWSEYGRNYYAIPSYKATANFVDGWLNGTLTITKRLEVSARTAGEIVITIDKLVANYKNGVPHGNWTYSRTFPNEGNRKGWHFNVNFKNGVLVGNYNYEGTSKSTGTFTQTGEYTGVWTRQSSEEITEVTLTNGVVLSWFNRKNGQVINKDEQAVGLKEMAQKFANKQITEEQLFEQGYFIKEVWGDDDIEEIFEYVDLHLDLIGGDKTRVEETGVNCIWGKPAKRLLKGHVAPKDLAEGYIWMLETGRFYAGMFKLTYPLSKMLMAEGKDASFDNDWYNKEIDYTNYAHAAELSQEAKDSFQVIIKRIRDLESKYVPISYIDYRKNEGCLELIYNARTIDATRVSYHLRHNDIQKIDSIESAQYKDDEVFYNNLKVHNAKLKVVKDSIARVEKQRADSIAKAKRDSIEFHADSIKVVEVANKLLNRTATISQNMKGLGGFLATNPDFEIGYDIKNNWSKYSPLFSGSYNMIYTDVPLKLKDFCPMQKYEILSVTKSEQNKVYIVTVQTQKFISKKKGGEIYKHNLFINASDGYIDLDKSLNFNHAELVGTYK